MATKSGKNIEKKGLTFRTDIILIILFLAAGAVFAAVMLIGKRDGKYVQISVDGVIEQTLPLDDDTEFVIKSADSGTNTLVIENGEAYMKDASCPDGLCVKMGKISLSGQSVICLPNKVVVEVIGEADENKDVDITVG